MQQLTISVNQIYHVFWDLRRDLTRVIDRVSSLEDQMTAQDRLVALDGQLLAHDRVAAYNSQLIGDPMFQDSLDLAATTRALDNNLFRNSRYFFSKRANKLLLLYPKGNRIFYDCNFIRTE